MRHRKFRDLRGRLDGRLRKTMLWANSNAFYVLDRVTGEFLLVGAFATQTWAAYSRLSDLV